MIQGLCPVDAIHKMKNGVLHAHLCKCPGGIAKEMSEVSLLVASREVAIFFFGSKHHITKFLVPELFIVSEKAK